MSAAQHAHEHAHDDAHGHACGHADGANEAAVTLLRTMAAADCDLLALLHAAEPSALILERLKAAPFSSYLGLKPVGASSRAALRELEAAVADLPTPNDAAGLEELAAEYADVYLRYSYRASPGESVWRDPDGLERQEPMFKVRKWFRHCGYNAIDEQHRTEDHIVCEVHFVAWAIDPRRGNVPLADVGRFLDEHPLCWIPAFATRLNEMNAHPFYVALALYTATALDDLRTHIEGVTGLVRTLLTVAAETTPLPSAEDARYVPGVAPSW